MDLVTDLLMLNLLPLDTKLPVDITRTSESIWWLCEDYRILRNGTLRLFGMLFVVQADADDDRGGLKWTKDLFGTTFVSAPVCLGFCWICCQRSVAYLAYGFSLVEFLEAGVWCSFKNVHSEALEARSELLLGHLAVVLLASRVVKRMNASIVML